MSFAWNTPDHGRQGAVEDSVNIFPYAMGLPISWPAQGYPCVPYEIQAAACRQIVTGLVSSMYASMPCSRPRCL